MGPEEPTHKQSLARKCAQIKHLNKLRDCKHNEKSLIMIVGIDANWVEWCTDCDKVTDKDSNYS